MWQIYAPNALIAILLAATCGCGTTMNMSDRERVDWEVASRDPRVVYVPKYQRPAFPFGGVANDIAWIKTSEQPIDVIFSAADIPFSLAGDFVTLPWSLHSWLATSEKHSKSSRQAQE